MIMVIVGVDAAARGHVAGRMIALIMRVLS
jgi:ribonuclease HII